MQNQPPPPHNVLPAPNGQQTQPPGQRLAPVSGRKDGKVWSLRVEQQPIRARMCGFGDKDRRPITPPPCIRLMVHDEKTGVEVDFNEIDPTFFVLGVDLWSADGVQEVNLVRHAGMLPVNSISAATTTSYPPPPERMEQIVHVMQNPMINPYTGQPMPPQPVQVYSQMPNTYRPGVQTPMSMPMTPSGMPPGGYAPQPGMPAYSQPQPQFAPTMQVQPQPLSAAGMFTRNLIGSLNVNAFRLTDPEGKVGFWFVLQDLSVRTEGTFRGNGATVSKGTCPVLASVFSDVFQVFSAKKFPGVIESTALSKCFAGQGIKIPIRKDAPKTLSNQAEYDADED
ncbi:MAG: hypothetical protein Q9157_003797 [Trypethelium eluteriae]